MLTSMSIPALKNAIGRAQKWLEWCRLEGDKLQIDLAEEGLNNLLDKLSALLKEEQPK